MNTQASSIALLNTVIPASGPILSGKDLPDQLFCLREILGSIAGQLSPSSIIADESAFVENVANQFAELTRGVYVAVNLGRGRNPSHRR
jgi:hypothetical protein